MALRQIEDISEAVGYVRLSKYDGPERSGATIRQEDNIREFADRAGFDLTRVYVDDDRSAYSGDDDLSKPRPGFDAMKRDIASGVSPPCVIFYAPDRLLRDVEEGERLRKWCRRQRVSLVSAMSGPVDLNDENGIFNFQLGNLLSERESRVISRRIKDNMERSVIARGKSLGGKPPYGYRQEGAKAPDGTDTRTFKIVPAEAKIVKEVISRVAAGETLTRIAQDLNERGVPTSREGGQGWRLTFVRRIALNGRYAGRMMHKGIDKGASAYPAIVDEALWRRAVAVLSDPSRPKRRASRRYLLSGGLLVCGKCGSSMSARPQRGRATYACPPKNRDGLRGGCGSVSIDARQLEDRIIEAVFARVESPAFAAKLKRAMGKSPKAAEGAKELAERQALVTKQYVAGRMTSKAYEDAMDDLAARLEGLQASVGSDTAVSAVSRYAGRQRKLRREWDAMSLDRQQAIVRAVIDHVVIAPISVGQGFRFDPSRIGSPVWR